MSGAAYGPLVIEGYASLFDVTDLGGDTVRAGAFARSLRRKAGGVPMLLGHVHGALAGRWTRMVEDARGLFVRGVIDPALPGGKAAREMVTERGLGGLSIGFRAEDWRPTREAGRELRTVDLKEVSLVAAPLLPGARFEVV
jgi:hypothetical protein